MIVEKVPTANDFLKPRPSRQFTSPFLQQWLLTDGPAGGAPVGL